MVGRTWTAGARGCTRHDRHFTYAENFGAPDCTMPGAGIAWKKTRMPVVTELWPARAEEVGAGLALGHGDDLERVQGKARISRDGISRQGRRVRQDRRAAAPPRGEVPDRYWRHRGAARRSGGAGLGGGGRPERDTDARGVPGLHRRLARRGVRGQARLCRAQDRVVQLPQRLLPRGVAAGRGAGHRVLEFPADRARPARVHNRRRSGRRDRGDRGRIIRPR